MLFAEHLTAEYRVKTEGRGRKVEEWKMRPEAHDNHWFDGVVGAAPTGFVSLRRPDRFASGASRGRRVDVRLRPRGDGHRAGAQAREAQGEAVGTSARETRVNLIPR